MGWDLELDKEQRFGRLWYQKLNDRHHIGVGGRFLDATVPAISVGTSFTEVYSEIGVAGDLGVLLPEPSPELLSLLDSLPDHGADYAVVDKLLEEYQELERHLRPVTAGE